MRTRRQILDSLEASYVQALRAAEERGDHAESARLELDFVRDQLQLEVLLDVRGLLLPPESEIPDSGKVQGLLDTAAKIRNLTRLR